MIWNCKEHKIEYGSITLIMGIINVTPDSFSDAGENFMPENAIKTAIEMQKNSADIIDIGAQSTRPNHIPISEKEEWSRLEKVLTVLKDKIDIPISVDTYYPYVAEKAIQMGASIINDVSGTVSYEMAEIIKKSSAGWIIMHNGSGSEAEVCRFFDEAEKKIEKYGINKNQICFDMGIGFGKTRSEDMSLISNIEKYKKEGYPLLLATSRKRVIRQYSSQENPKECVYGNISADTVAILGGADIIRLHDIEKEKQGILMADALKKFKKN